MSAPVVTCACGLYYSLAEWEALPLLGLMDHEEDGDQRLELRNCACGSTCSRALPPPASGALPWPTTEGEEYGARIDVVVRRAQGSEFTREEWVKLAYAALDQAGVRTPELANILAFSEVGR